MVTDGSQGPTMNPTARIGEAMAVGERCDFSLLLRKSFFLGFVYLLIGYGLMDGDTAGLDGMKVLSTACQPRLAAGPSPFARRRVSAILLSRPQIVTHGLAVLLLSART